MATALTRISAYELRRGELEHYFDRTAAEAWRRLTSDEPVSRIRATVRAGRDRMRATLLSWLPDDLTGRRILDAGCGTGAFTIEAARRGAEVVAVDIAPSLVEIARRRLPDDVDARRVEFLSGDMLASDLGRFDHVVAMDSLIHYDAPDIVAMLTRVAERTERSLLFTVAPRTPALALMHTAGRLFPKKDRAPAIVPVAERRLHRLIGAASELQGWNSGRTQRVSGGFYTSQALELVRA